MASETTQPSFQTTSSVLWAGTGSAGLVHWDSTRCRVTPTQLSQVAIAAGLPDTVKSINPEAALRKAVGEYSVVRGRKTTHEAVVAHVDADYITINILELRQESEKNMIKVTVDDLIWDRHNCRWFDPGIIDEAKALRERVEDRQLFYRRDDVVKAVVMPALKAAHALPISRGIYVVPASSSMPISMAQSALNNCLGESFALHAHPLEGAAKASMSAAVQNAQAKHVESSLAKLHEQIEGWNKMASSVRSDTIERVMDRFTELSLQANLFKEALAIEAEDVEKAIEAMQARAIEVIEGKNHQRGPSEEEIAKANHVARVKTITDLPSAEFTALWDFLLEGTEVPTDRTSAINLLAEAVGSAA